MADNDLTYYKAALAGEKPPLHDGHPHAGYYRLRWHRDKPWLPVVIYLKDGKLVALVGHKRAQRDAAAVWTRCGDKPMTKADTMHAFNNNGAWPSDAPEATAEDVPEDSPPPMGDNEPPEDLSVVEKIAATTKLALDWLKGHGIKDKKSADMASNYRRKLLQLKKDAELEHKVEKDPHWQKCKEIDGKYKPSISDAEGVAAELRGALTVYMNAEDARLQREAEEAARKANEEARKKAAEERAKREAEAEAEAARKLEATEPAPDPVPQPEPTPVVKPAPVKVQVGGQRGARTGLKPVKRAVITDYDEVLWHFAQHEKVRALIDQLAQHAVRDGHKVPGVEIKNEKVAA